MSEPAKVMVDGREFVAEAAEKQAFDASLAAFDKGNFANAQIGFASFVRRFSQGNYKASALFWLGNSQYALHNYGDAEATFQALVVAESTRLHRRRDCPWQIAKWNSWTSNRPAGRLKTS